VKKLDPGNLISLLPEFLHSFRGLRGILTAGSKNSLMASPSGKKFNEGIFFQSIRVVVFLA
jgi:D-lyxose ketol-isomerase